MPQERHKSSRLLTSPRYAGEVVIERKKRPPRVIPWGRMTAPPQNDVALPDTYRVRRQTTWGEWIDDPVPRRRMGDRHPGARAPYRGDSVQVVTRETLPVDALADAMALVQRGLATGEMCVGGRTVRLALTLTGAVRTIPDKGPILKWASTYDLADAIARGIF
jgi:hypothetical protein